MFGVNIDEEETPFGVAAKHRRSMRTSLFLGWLFLAVAGGIACLPFNVNFVALLVLVMVSIIISMGHFFDAGYARAQKLYEPKLLTKDRKYKELEDQHREFVAFCKGSMFGTAMSSLNKMSANRQKSSAPAEPVAEVEKEEN